MSFCRGQSVFSRESVAVEFGSTIEHVNPSLQPESAWIAPGFIDLQINGFAGADYNDPATPKTSIDASLQALFATGVTRLFPTVITGSSERISGALRNLAEARQELPHGHAMEAFHLEGPYISPEDGPRGAHSRE